MLKLIISRCIAISLVMLCNLSFAKTPPTFSVNPLTSGDEQLLQAAGMWQADCPMPLTRLRKLTVAYYDFAGKVQEDGQLIVLDVIAEHMLSVFQSLFAQRFPIAAMVPISNAPMQDGQAQKTLLSNTSAFYCRKIRNSKIPVFSVHAYGLAIDINSQENPYIAHKYIKRAKRKHKKSLLVIPASGKAYIQRKPHQPGMVEPIVDTLQAQGFHSWGGDWQYPLDYMHFQPINLIAELLAIMPYTDGITLFTLTQQYPQAIQHLAMPADQYTYPAQYFAELSQAYRANPQTFLRAFADNIALLEAGDAQSFVQACLAAVTA
jgi:hypothetical protein